MLEYISHYPRVSDLGMMGFAVQPLPPGWITSPIVPLALNWLGETGLVVQPLPPLVFYYISHRPRCSNRQGRDGSCSPAPSPAYVALRLPSPPSLELAVAGGVGEQGVGVLPATAGPILPSPSISLPGREGDGTWSPSRDSHSTPPLPPRT